LRDPASGAPKPRRTPAAHGAHTEAVVVVVAVDVDVVVVVVVVDVVVVVVVVVVVLQATAGFGSQPLEGCK